jgi:hypothetical protein
MAIEFIHGGHDAVLNGVNATVGIRANEFRGDLGNKSKLTTLSKIAR